MADREQTTTAPRKLAMPERGAERYDYGGQLRVMCGADGWLLIRRPHCKPFAITVKDWHLLSDDPMVIGTPLAPRASTFGVLA